jgi:3-phenylpropionate/trans-cinnamate dioxygenase ferredoxin component
VTSFEAVCRLADLAPNSARRFIVAGTAVAVARTDDGVYAINDRCSHADVSLADGEIDGCAIECWLHGSAFDLRTGVPLSLPATEPVATYAVRVTGDGDDATIEVDPAPLRATSPSQG